MENCSHAGQPFAVRADMWGPHHAYQVPWEMKDLLDEDEIMEYPTFREPPSEKAKMVQDFRERIHDRNPLQSWEDWKPLMKRAYEHYSYIDKAVGELLAKLDEKGLSGLVHREECRWREDFMAEHFGHFGIRVAQRTLYYKNFKYIATEKDVHEMYDPAEDPFERKNLIHDPEYRETAAELRRRLLANMDRYKDDSEYVTDIRKRAAER